MVRPLFHGLGGRPLADETLGGGVPDQKLSFHVGDHNALADVGQDGLQNARLLVKLFFSPLALGDVLDAVDDVGDLSLRSQDR